MLDDCAQLTRRPIRPIRHIRPIRLIRRFAIQQANGKRRVIDDAADGGRRGAALVFLPGVAEIRKLMGELARLVQRLAASPPIESALLWFDR